MLPHRKYLLILTLVVVGGSLGWTAGYGLRLRGESYRRQVERDLTDFFELPCDVGRIRGHTFRSRSFEDVEIWLPDRRDRVFSCRQAIWWEGEQDGDSRNQLDLDDGVLMLGSDRWKREDYRQVFESGLGHDFEDLDLGSVELSNFAIAFDKGEWSIRCGQTSGRIDMTDPSDGLAHLVAYELNGYRIGEGAKIDARFSPRSGVEISEFTIQLPEVPLPAIGLNKALGGDVTSGRFAGRVHYRKGQDKPEVWLDGKLEDANLTELTRAVPFGPLEGRFSVNVYAARIAESLVTHFRGHGEVSALSLRCLGPLLGKPDLSGTAALNVDAVDIALGHINRLRFEGVISGLLLEDWLSLLGHGSATGELIIRVNNLDVVNDRIRSADIEINVAPPPGEHGTIDRTLLIAAAERLLDFTWPPSLPQEVLPEQLRYAEFGVRLLVKDNRLRILGTHGSEEDTILTIVVFGKPFPLVKEPSESIDLGPHLTGLLERARMYNPDRVRDWLDQQRDPAKATSRPALGLLPQR